MHKLAIGCVRRFTCNIKSQEVFYGHFSSLHGCSFLHIYFLYFLSINQHSKIILINPPSYMKTTFFILGYADVVYLESLFFEILTEPSLKPALYTFSAVLLCKFILQKQNADFPATLVHTVQFQSKEISQHIIKYQIPIPQKVFELLILK